GERAYKLKRAVAYASLDFRSLEGRARACHAELALNRRTAPNLYLGVGAITREADGQLAFDGTGAVLDWVVVMRRFPQNALFERMAVAGTLTRSEEHTSELQSRENLVCRLLLEKKKASETINPKK